MMNIVDTLSQHPVIAAVRNLESAKCAAKSNAAAIFILGGNIMTLPDILREVHDAGKYAFVHIDLAEGLGRDDAAVEWCAKTLQADGLISTRPQLLRKASEMGMVTIQRLFLMDSTSFEHGKKLLRNTPPDMAEVLPGIAPKAIRQLSQALNKPVIAGGMISEKSEIITALDAGAIAVSVSDPLLWNL